MIKLFVTDIDGVLTDGTYSVFSTIEGRSKTFHTRDFHGLNMLNESGIRVVAISQDFCHAVSKQFKRAAPFAHLHEGVINKKKFIERHYMDALVDSFEEVAYIGDDLPDAELLQAAGFAACPADAEPSIISLVQNHRNGIVLTRPGGRACVREFVNIVLEAEASA